MIGAQQTMAIKAILQGTNIYNICIYICISGVSTGNKYLTIQIFGELSMKQGYQEGVKYPSMIGYHAQACLEQWIASVASGYDDHDFDTSYFAPNAEVSES
jgi:hypothetical protein